MDRKKAWILIILTLVVAVVVPLSFQLFPSDIRTHTLTLEAKKYGYSPSRIIVNKGDKIVLKPTSLDATHGFLLDGHPIEFIMRKGAAFLKYTWEDEDGNLQADWDRVSEVEFVADKAGKFTFRCTQTCGNLHPFMTGELIVRPNAPYYLFISLSIWLVFSLLVYFRTDSGSGFSGFQHINLLEKFPWFKKILKLRSFQFLIILPNFIVFYLFMLSSLWGSPVGNRNIAIIFVWILWWFVLKAIIVPLGGRIWCMVCPLPAPSEWLAAPSVPRLAKGLAQTIGQHLAAKYPFSGADLFRYYSHHSPDCHGIAVSAYPDHKFVACADLPAPGFLPVHVPGGGISGHLFHGFDDRTQGC
jgi:hypothetical protein